MPNFISGFVPEDQFQQDTPESTTSFTPSQPDMANSNQFAMPEQEEQAPGGFVNPGFTSENGETPNQALQLLSTPNPEINRGRFSYLLQKGADLTDKLMGPISSFLYGNTSKVLGGLPAALVAETLPEEQRLKMYSEIDKSLPTNSEVFWAALESLPSTKAGSFIGNKLTQKAPEKVAKITRSVAGKKTAQDLTEEAVKKLTIPFEGLSKGEKIKAAKEGLIDSSSFLKGQTTKASSKVKNIASKVASYMKSNNPLDNIQSLDNNITRLDNKAYTKLKQSGEVVSHQNLIKKAQSAVKKNVDIAADATLDAKRAVKMAQQYTAELISKAKDDSAAALMKARQAFDAKYQKAINNVVTKGPSASAQEKIIKQVRDVAQDVIDKSGGKIASYKPIMKQMSSAIQAKDILAKINALSSGKSGLEKIAEKAGNLPGIKQGVNVIKSFLRFK